MVKIDIQKKHAYFLVGLLAIVSLGFVIAQIIPNPGHDFSQLSACLNPGEILKSDGTTWNCAVDDSGTGDITGVSAGTGLSGGGVSGDVSLNVNTNVIQNRVLGACGNTDESIKSINVDGTVTCETDDIGGGSALET